MSQKSLLAALPVFPRTGPPSAVTLAATFALFAFLVLAALGLMGAWPSPDTQSYLAADTLGQARLPLYGALLHLLPLQGVAVPLLQWSMFAAASCALVAAIRRFGASWAAATAVGLALIGSNLLLLWGNALLPEVLAHAALLLALAAALRLAVIHSHRSWIVIASAGVTLAWALRPSLLPFVVLVPVFLVLLAPDRRGIAAWLAVACVVPMLLLCTVRLVRVGDFNVVSFGGYQMSGMAALMLTPDVVNRLPPESAATGRDILARRAALEEAGAVIAIPVNSGGQRSFVSAAVFYFDILARTHDSVLSGAVAKQQRPNEAWPAFNRRMQRFALMTIKAAPVPYVAWVLGGMSRLVGHALVLNPAFLLASASLLLLAWRRPRSGTPEDMRLLLILVGIYTAGSGALSVLITFPASRYVDSAALLLAVLPAYGVLRRLAR